MGWSDWQDGPIHTATWADVGRGTQEVGQAANGDWNMGDASTIGSTIYAASSEDDITPYPYGGVYQQARGAYFRLDPAWTLRRDSIPAPLSDLEFGVDWGENPTWDGVSDDRYVQYEPGGESRALSTLGPDVRFVNGVKGGGEGSERDGDGAWTLGYVLDVTAPPPYSGSGTNEVPEGLWPGLGTPVASGDYTVTPGTRYQSAFPDITGHDRLFVSPRMTGTPPLFGLSSLATFSIGRPELTYQLPRWRYWIPGILPLRQFPRDDGLRGGPARLTPGSRQAGRGNGYL